MSATYEKIGSDLAEGPGYSVIENFLEVSDLQELVADFSKAYSEGRFRSAKIGQGERLREESEIRNDQTLWFNPHELSPAETRLLEKFEELRLFLNAQLLLGLWDLEGHYAFYPPGGFYKKHRDRFLTSDLRTISIVLYLNLDWKPADGGELLIYGPRPHKVEPRGGTLVCFLSDRVEHEVAPAGSARRSFAGWFRRRSLGAPTG